MSSPTIKLLYNNNKNNNTTIKNAIRISSNRNSRTISTSIKSNNIKNKSKNKTQKNYIKRKIIKNMPKIKIINSSSSSNPNKSYLFMLTSSNNNEDNIYINWLVHIEKNNSNSNEISKQTILIPYRIQKDKRGVYGFTQSFYPLDNLGSTENIQVFINELNDIIKKSKTFKNLYKIDRILIYNDIMNSIKNKGLGNLISNDQKFNVNLDNYSFSSKIGNGLNLLTLMRY